jgi:hypothetical protein
VAIGLAAGGCADRAPTTAPDAPAPPPPFAEEAAPRGLHFTHVAGRSAQYLNPEVMAGGAALFDMDGDGDLDAYLVQGGSLVEPGGAGGANELFRNRGDGTFERVEGAAGAGDRGYGMGVAAGDYDNDGDVDLYVTNLGPNVLLRNDGARFTDVTATAGTSGHGAAPGHPTKSWSAGAAFLDYDADGDLDLFVANYLEWSIEKEIRCQDVAGARDYCAPQVYDAPAASILYRNDGDGSFTDVTTASGIGAARGTSLGVAVGDYDGDGRLDVFVANDGMPNHLWIGNADGTFTNLALAMGCGVDEAGAAKAGMGVGSADVDGDGALDLLVVNLQGETDSLFLGRRGYFIDSTASAGLGRVSRAFTRFGTGLLDFDNDGRLDLYQANGRVRRTDVTFAEDPYAEPNLLMRGAAAGGFTEVLPRGGTEALLAHTSRGAAFGDVDDDGGIDVLVANSGGPAYLLHNRAAPRGRWISFRVLEEHGRDALGATVTATVGGRLVRRDVQSAYSYCSASDMRVHFGLGEHERVESVTVRWVGGPETVFGGFDAGRVVTLRRHLVP